MDVEGEIDSNPNDLENSDVHKLLPMRRFFRQRAHCNPWSDHTLDYPLNPDEANWSQLFELDQILAIKVKNVDIGCGYGGLLLKLASLFPDEYSVGMEIRIKVSDYVQEKIRALRTIHPGEYRNITCIRTNAMKFLNQLERMFFLYPDPHFKKGKHKWRIITKQLLDVYAYLLAPNGRIYAASDVPELAKWMYDCLASHPCFKKRCFVQLKTAYIQLDSGNTGPEQELNSIQVVSLPEILPDAIQTQEEFEKLSREDKLIEVLAYGCTEEAMKASREKRGTAIIVFEKIHQT